MDKQVIQSKQVPTAVGAYSQVIRYGNLIFISGQVSEDIKTGEIIRQDVASQTKTIMDTIYNVLTEVGSSMDKILKCTVHLSDIKHFDAMNRVYATYFKRDYPARLAVSGVQLYDGVDVEIDVIAGI